jgi:hypothetical protein
MTDKAPDFIIDNANNNSRVAHFLAQWCEDATQMDIATGYFEISALLKLEGKWQKMDKIRILMGDEVSKRTYKALDAGAGKKKAKTNPRNEFIIKRSIDNLDADLTILKGKDEFLSGVDAIVEAIESGKIEIRVYHPDKFHAKCYITYPKKTTYRPSALVGSSNFTYPGLHENVELNVRLDGNDVGPLQDWYNTHWEAAHPLDPRDLKVRIIEAIKRHLAPVDPFHIYLKALDEHFKTEELAPDAWDKNESDVFDKLSGYQKDAYRNLFKIASKFRLGFLCDGVGIGKTFVGLMLMERYARLEKKNVLLMAPKSAKETIWDIEITEHLKATSLFDRIHSLAHTDLQLQDGDELQKYLATIRDADVIIIDEAHNFRNEGSKGSDENQASRYHRLKECLQSDPNRTKTVIFLTASPINNSVHDFRRMIQLVTGEANDYFKSIGIPSIKDEFAKIEETIEADIQGRIDEESLSDSEKVSEAYDASRLFHHIVVQRSRRYVKESQIQSKEDETLFPHRNLPIEVEYDIEKTCPGLLKAFVKACTPQQKLFYLAMYNPTSYRYEEVKGEKEILRKGREGVLVILIRTIFLKRFESSTKAFETSCWALMGKLMAWLEVNIEDQADKKMYAAWKNRNSEMLTTYDVKQRQLFPADQKANDDRADRVLSALDGFSTAGVEKLDKKEYKLEQMIRETLNDLETLTDILSEALKVEPTKDQKVQQLISLLKTDPKLKGQKVIIFTESTDTARYLEENFKGAGIKQVSCIDGGATGRQRLAAVRKFAPYYNPVKKSKHAGVKDSAEYTEHELLKKDMGKQTMVLIATDILAEGLNLQDSCNLINFDLNWNPVRLLQRIGRVDRRLNKATEADMVKDHPELTKMRRQVYFWNFLPPKGLNEVLSLFSKVTTRVSTISAVLGLEGNIVQASEKNDPVRLFNQKCDGVLSAGEEMQLEYMRLLREYPDDFMIARSLPEKAFSGRKAEKGISKGIFYCFRLPGQEHVAIGEEEPDWSADAGDCVWLYYNRIDDKIVSDQGEIWKAIRSDNKDKRLVDITPEELATIRKKVERFVKMEYIEPLDAVADVGDGKCICWMQVT